MVDPIPRAARARMEYACKRVARKIGKSVRTVDSGGKLEKAIADKCRKEVRTIDKTAVQFFADKLREALDKKNKRPAGPGPMPRASAKWVPKPPGSGVPSLTIPITEWVVDPRHDTRARFSIKVWADPRDLKKTDKGAMVHFTVVNW